MVKTKKIKNIQSGLILENKSNNQKRARKSSKRAQLWIFNPHFFKFRAFKTPHPTKRHVVLEVLVENKAFHFSKRALRAGTTCNRWLKKVQLIIISFYCWNVTFSDNLQNLLAKHCSSKTVNGNISRMCYTKVNFPTKGVVFKLW